MYTVPPCEPAGQVPSGGLSAAWTQPMRPRPGISVAPATPAPARSMWRRDTTGAVRLGNPIFDMSSLLQVDDRLRSFGPVDRDGNAARGTTRGTQAGWPGPGCCRSETSNPSVVQCPAGSSTVQQVFDDMAL